MVRTYNKNPDSFESDIEDLIGVRPDGWTFHPGYIQIYFRHTPSEDRPTGQPLSWDALETLDAEFDVQQVESNSYGRTGSRLVVRISDY